MSLKSKIWEWGMDPVVRKIESRLAHFQRQRPSRHDGRDWQQRATIGQGAVFYAEASLANGGRPDQLRIGEFCHVRGEITITGPGSFAIGHHSFIGPGTRIWCANQVTIGDHVLISHLVDIHDSSSHSLDWRARRAEGTSLFERGVRPDSVDVLTGPVTIGDDVWIGFKSSILRDVTIGRGAVIAACSVVTKDVPPFTLVAGNPAQVIKDLPQ